MLERPRKRLRKRTAERNNEQAENHGSQADESQKTRFLFSQRDQHKRHFFGEEKIGDPLEHEGQTHSNDKKGPVDIHRLFIAGIPDCVHQDNGATT